MGVALIRIGNSLVKSLGILLGLLFGILPVMECSLWAKADPTIVIVHSYSPDYEWTIGQDYGIRAAYKKYYSGNETRLIRIYLNQKKKTGAELEGQVALAKERIKTAKPAGVVLTDDFAFEKLSQFVRHLKITQSFSGVNKELSDYGYTGKEKGIAGTFERYNMSATARLLMALRPSIRNILILADDDITGTTLTRQAQDQIREDQTLEKIGLKLDFYNGSSFEGLKRKLLSVNPETTGVLFTSFYRLIDSNSRSVNYTEVDQWVNENTRFLDAGLVSFHVKNGRLISLAGSDYENGFYAGELLFKALTTGIDISKFGVRRFVPLQLQLNHKRAKQIRVTFPFEILSYALSSEFLFSEWENGSD